MKHVAFVSTFGQQCGIATYTEELASAMVAGFMAAPLVLAPSEAGVGLREVPGVPWRTSWSRNTLDLYEQLQGFLPGVDVLHFQHEDGLFRNAPVFLAALNMLRTHHPNIRRVVTLHTVRHYGGWECVGFYDDLLALADVVVVHTAEALASLSQTRRPTAQLIHIPHGTAVVAPVARDVELRARGLARLGVVNASIVERVLANEVTLGLVQGFQGPSKNTVATIRAFAEGISRRLIPKSVLVISGEAAEPSWWNTLNGVAYSTGYEHRIIISTRFTKQHEMPAVMAAADYGVLNTNAWVLSSSGAAHMFAAHGVPITCANRPIYHEALQGGAIPFWLGESPEIPTLSTVNAIAALASHQSVRQAIRHDMLEWAERTSWQKIAKRHMEAYGD